MKILYVLDCRLDTIGGSQQATKTIMAAMLDKNAEVALLSQYSDNINSEIFNPKINFVFYKPKKNKILNALTKMRTIKKLIKNERYDIIHVQNSQYFVVLGFLLKFRLVDKSGTKFLFTDNYFYNSYSKRYRRLLKIFAEYYDGVYCTTSQNAREWKKFHNNVAVITNVLDETWFDYDVKREQQIKEKYGLENKTVIGFCGRFIPIKRWDNVIKIYERLKDYENVFFSFVLSFNSKQEEENIRAFKNALKEQKKDNYIIFEKANRELMEEFYYMLDAFVLTSDKESFGLTLIEAMTKNNVVFGTNAGGVPDVLPSKDYLFEVNDIDAICAKLLEIYENKDLKNQKASSLRAYCKENFSSKKMTEAYYKDYQNMLYQNKGNDAVS